MKSERTHFRVEYPEKARPILEIKKRCFPVINISEEGILFRLPPNQGRVTVGNQMQGFIIFSDNERIAIKGKILRNFNETVAIHLSAGISLKRIMTEQRWLLSEFGTLKRPERLEDES